MQVLASIFKENNYSVHVGHTYLLNENSKSNQFCTFVEQKLLSHMIILRKLTFYTIPVNHNLDGPG